jgi:hypothetical protein
MSNLLRPFGIPRTAYDLPWSERNRSAPDSGSDPMPSHLGAAIRTRQGARRLLPDELAKGLGVPAEWGDLTAFPGSLLNHLTGIHTWEAIGRVVSPLFNTRPEGLLLTPDDQPASSVPSARRQPTASSTHTDSQFHSEEGHFEWVNTDLSLGSPWHLACIYNLVDACKGLRDRKQQFLNGLADLDRHQANYGPDGIRQLQVLWWESVRTVSLSCSRGSFPSLLLTLESEHASSAAPSSLPSHTASLPSTASLPNFTVSSSAGCQCCVVPELYGIVAACQCFVEQ